MLSKELEFTLNHAFKQARENRHEFMTVEHLLLALLDDPAAAPILKACGADLEALRVDLLEFLASHIPQLADNSELETQPTLGFQRVIQRAVFQVQSSEKGEATGANVLVAMFNEKESQAIYILGQHQITRLDVVNYIAHGIARDEP
ncbi:MAG: ATP-dependent Clp protease ATP-binding subunit ClpA, partial [Gammaproteobacteria bacterium]|nr:ATP-dependent Clp protease ATP-binding subunit ClpA [Gammaproteobacteria bacterium]